MSRTHDPIDKRLRNRLRRQREEHCPICRGALGPILYDVDHLDPRGFQMDHIVPLSRGGQKRWDNLQAVHRQCNRAKSRPSARRSPSHAQAVDDQDDDEHQAASGRRELSTRAVQQVSRHASPAPRRHVRDEQAMDTMSQQRAGEMQTWMSARVWGGVPQTHRVPSRGLRACVPRDFEQQKTGRA